MTNTVWRIATPVEAGAIHLIHFWKVLPFIRDRSEFTLSAPKRSTNHNSVDQFYAAIWSLFTLRLTGLAMESFINMPPQMAFGLSVWRPVDDSAEQVMGEGLPFLRNKARQYGLI